MAGRSTSTTSTELADRLAAFLRARGMGEVAIENLRRLPGGASRETWAFEAVSPTRGTERLVLRRDPSGHRVQTSRRDEFELLRAAHAAAVPVPRVRWCEDDPAVLGAPFFIMDFVEGETLPRRLLRDAEYAAARTALPDELARVLAAIHAIDVRDPVLAFLPAPAVGEIPAVAELERHEQLYRAVAPEPHPALELALRWLRARAPTAARRTLVHGDFRIGNVIFGPSGLRAVIDWELAHGGDPMEDLGWLSVRSWRFGAVAPVGGLCTRERFFAAYEASSGHAVDVARVRWWEVFGNLKWAVICLLQARTFLDGAVKSVELASLGRRIAEMELELLDLTEG